MSIMPSDPNPTPTHDAAREQTMDTPDNGFHPVNLTHLIMGIAFASFAGIWAAVTADWLPVDDLSWVLPIPWLLAGSAGLVAATLGRRRREGVAGRDSDVRVVGDHPIDPRA